VDRLELEAFHAKLLTGNGKYADAERILKHHLATHPNDTNAWFDLANTALSNLDYEGAKAAFGRFVELKPNSPAEMGAIARLEGYSGDFDEAFRWAKRAFELEPSDDNLEVYLNTAESLGRTDDLQAALETKAKLERNASAVVYLRLAGLLAATGQEQQQWEALKSGLAVHPTNALLRAQAAFYHADKQRYSEAAEVMRGSPNIRSDPAQLELYARLLVQSLRLEEADRLLKEPLPREFLEQTSILGMRAYLAENFNRLDEAVTLFGILAGREPASDYYALNHARLLARTGEVEKALAILSPRLADPTPEVMELAADVYSAAGKTKEAIDWQLRLIAAGPPNLSAAHRVLGDFYLSRGNPIEAKRSYKRALDLFLGTLAMADSQKAAATR
jgi:tetratricopeptide (TPR) repeat protein